MKNRYATCLEANIDLCPIQYIPTTINLENNVLILKVKNYQIKKLNNVFKHFILTSIKLFADVKSS